MTEIFTVMVEPEWIYSALERSHTLQYRTTTKLHSGRLLSWISFHFSPSPAYFNHCIYQHLSGWFYLEESRKVIMMWCLKLACFEYNWSFDHYPNNFLRVFWNACMYLRASSDNTAILNTKIQKHNFFNINIECTQLSILTSLQNSSVNHPLQDRQLWKKWKLCVKA